MMEMDLKMKKSKLTMNNVDRKTQIRHAQIHTYFFIMQIKHEQHVLNHRKLESN